MAATARLPFTLAILARSATSLASGTDSL